MKPSIKAITIVIGTLLGAFLGFSIASTLVKEAEERGQKVPINSQQGFKLGIGLWRLFHEFDKLVK